jgi:monovalent cation:H+ antiporter-2, CPA2 family
MDSNHLDSLTSIALVTMVALLCGLALIRLRQPAIVGYIIAGVVLGPTGFALVQNTHTVQMLAELGVIMLLFLIGMELSLKSFKLVYKTALSAAALQIAMAFAVFWVLGMVLHWPLPRVTVFAFATALSSTAVAIKMLDETNDLKTPVGRTTVSVLIAQDLAIIPMMLIVGAFGQAGGTPIVSILVKLALSVGVLGGIIAFLSRRKQVVLPMSSWVASKPEIMPLAAMAFCFTLATLSGSLGLSPAYGAFVSGLIVGNSSLRSALHKAAEPIQVVLLMVFFLSIGLLLDLHYIIENWRNVLLVLSVVTVLKTVVNVFILHWLGEPWRRSFHAGAVMAQVGEFSFVICAAGLAGQALTDEGYRLMIAVIALSLLISPMWLAVARKMHDAAVIKLRLPIDPAPSDDRA